MSEKNSSGSSGASKARIFNPPELHAPTGYSHVAEVAGGKLVFISGQIALDRNGELVGKGDFAAQTRQIFENLRVAVGAAGGSLRDIIKLNYYCVDLSHMQEIREVRNTFLDKERYPVSTAVEVRSLVRPEFLVEIDAVALIP
jgi:enamine deaminase RidA (YjgF/YER057c/UK114 family)